MFVGFVSCGEDDDSSYISMKFTEIGTTVTWTKGEQGVNDGLAYAKITTEGVSPSVGTHGLFMKAYSQVATDTETLFDAIWFVFYKNSSVFEPGDSYVGSGELIYNREEYSVSVQANITKVGDEGEMIVGTFAGTATKLDAAGQPTSTRITISKGEINLKRVAAED